MFYCIAQNTLGLSELKFLLVVKKFSSSSFRLVLDFIIYEFALKTLSTHKIFLEDFISLHFCCTVTHEGVLHLS